MDYRKWLHSEFAIIEKRVEKSISNEVLQYKDVRDVNLTLLLKDHVAFGLKTYKNEVIRIIDDLYKFEFLSHKDLKIIRDFLIQNTDNAFNHITEYCHADKDNNEYKHILDNINCIIEFSIEKLIILRRRKVYQVLWELLSIVISALVGALVALLFQS